MKNNQILQQIFVKQEIFDHLIYPLSIKIDDNSIIQLFRKLHIMSSIDYKITLDDWLFQSVSFLNGFTEKEAIILFNTYKIISSEYEISNHFQNKKNEMKNTVDVRYFGLFFALQCYLQKNKNHIDTLDKNAYATVSGSSTFTPISSPRSKQNSLRLSSSSLNEIGNMINFIKANIKLFLRLVATDIHNSETQLNSGEFNTLDFFFRFNTKNFNSNQKSGLSGIAPFFMNFSPTTKVNIEKITEWLSSNVNLSNNEVDENTIILKNLSKCLTVKEDITGKNIKILNCEDSQIFIDSLVCNIKISNCSNCIIFCAAVQKFTTIELCRNTSICIFTNFLKIGNCIDCKFNFFSCQEPVLYGDNKSLILGPHNVAYSGLESLIKSSKLNYTNGKDDLFASPILMHYNPNVSSSNVLTIKNTYEIQALKDFTQMITPFNKEEITYNGFLITPIEYLQTLKNQSNVLFELKEKINNSKLNDQQEKLLHEAIQGHFKEWLQSTGKMKNICDIIKVMDLSESMMNENN